MLVVSDINYKYTSSIAVRITKLQTMKKSYNNGNETPVSVNAYAVVAGTENDVYFPEAIASTVESFSAPARGRVDPNYLNIPEANGLTWTDTFFDDDYDDVIAVFDFDYENMESYYSSLSWCVFGSTFLCSGVFWTLVTLGVPCFINSNVRWNIRNQHVAVTRSGVIFVHDKRPSCWGLPCTEVGKSTRSIPIDSITDVKVQEAAGKSCLCIENTLHSVMVETPNRGVNDSGTFALPGLKNPEGFRRLVMALKGKTGTSAAVPATIAEVMDRAVADGGNTENVATLLREIRDELRQHNEVLQGLNPNSRHLSPSAPPGESGFMS